MNLTERFFEMTADVRDQASTYAERTAEAARSTVEKAAERVESAAGPIDNLSSAATRFNKLAHQYADDMLSHQANILTGALQDGAERLRLLNKSTSLKSAYGAQIKYFGVTRDRLARDAKVAMSIVSKTGTALRSLARDTLVGLKAKPATARRVATQVRKASRKTTRRVRKAA